MISPYLDGFKDWADICEHYQKAIPEPQYVLFAVYPDMSYEGQSTVIFYDAGKYWLEEAGHCSCYGLEGMWEPISYDTAELLIKCVIDRSYGDIKQHQQFILDAIKRNERRIK